MNINLLMPEVRVSGPSVPFELVDIGKAHVAITLMLSDGTSFAYAGGPAVPQFTILPVGRYECFISISAFNHGNAFGSEYNSIVKIGGHVVAIAQDSIPGGQTSDQSMTACVVEVV